MKLNNVIKELISEQAEAYSSVAAYLSQSSNCAGLPFLGFVGENDYYSNEDDFDLLKAIYDGGNFTTTVSNFVFQTPHDYPGLFAFGDEEFMSNLIGNTEDLINNGYCFSNENMTIQQDVFIFSDVNAETGSEVFKRPGTSFYLKFYTSWADDCGGMSSDCEYIIHDDGNYRIKTADNISGECAGTGSDTSCSSFTNWQSAINWLNNNIYVDNGAGWVQGIPLGASFTPSEYEQWLGTLNNLDTPQDSYVSFVVPHTVCTGCQPPVQGCMNSNADNFNPDATVDNGLCCSDDNVDGLPMCTGGGHPQGGEETTFHTAAEDVPTDDTSTDNVIPVKEPIKYDKEKVKPQPKPEEEDEQVVKQKLNKVKQIDGLPVFETKEEAETEAEKMGCEGSHEHELNDRTVYMPCESHDEIIKIGKQEKPKEKLDYIPDSETPIDRALNEEIRRIKDLM